MMTCGNLEISQRAKKNISYLRMELSKPNVSEDFAEKLVQKLYGLEVLTMKRMNSYDDQNFHIQVSQAHTNNYIKSVCEDGYTLKITNTEKSAIAGHFDAMHATMLHLHSKGLRVPIPLKNLSGNTWSLEKVPLLNEDENEKSEKCCGIHVLTFLPGVPLSTINCSNDILYQWGILMGKYHNATQDFVCPGLRDKYVFWNLENIPKIKDYVHVLPADKKKIVDSILDRYPEEIEKNAPHFPRGIIHGDFNENNVLIQKQHSECGSTLLSVDGVLDFEDIHEGTYVWDVGVMMMYAMIVYTEENVLCAPGHVLAGYLTERKFNNLELNSLKMCIECRFCQSLVYGAYSYSRDPQNEYLLETSKTGWDKLKSLTSEKNEDLLQRWKNIADSWIKK
ncbi:hydroxylysine kinase [Parasteatoda tepidariorum]|uniref:hydroxylysine kinase n=1 Tax=Parasteatoda tepidariorum TaxID=114398 RepID=UPI0039BC4E7D